MAAAAPLSGNKHGRDDDVVVAESFVEKLLRQNEEKFQRHLLDERVYMHQLFHGYAGGAVDKLFKRAITARVRAGHTDAEVRFTRDAVSSQHEPDGVTIRVVPPTDAGQHYPAEKAVSACRGIADDYMRCRDVLANFVLCLYGKECDIDVEDDDAGGVRVTLSWDTLLLNRCGSSL